MRTRTPNATKNAVLDSAERLFAANGFEATSLRSITAGAHANLGAVNYHFTSKDALILEVLKRRMRPLNEERMALLVKFEKEAKGRPVAVRKILEALFRPALDALSTPSKGGKYFLKLLSLVLAEPGSYLLPLIKEEFKLTLKRFHAALKQALPDSTDLELYWKLHFAMGAFVHTVAHGRVLKISSDGLCAISSIDDTMERLITFCAGGFEAKNETIHKGAKI